VGAYLFVDGLPGGDTDGTWKIQLFSGNTYTFGTAGDSFADNFQNLKNVSWTGASAPDPKSHDFSLPIPQDSAGQTASTGPENIAPLLQGGSISYNIKNSGSLTVTSNDDNKIITADLYLVLPLNLKLSTGGESMTIGGTTYRHVTMGALEDNTKDLFGRETGGGDINDLLAELDNVSLSLNVVKNDLIGGLYLGLGFPFSVSGSVSTGDKVKIIDLSDTAQGSTKNPYIVNYSPEDINTVPFNPGFGLYVPNGAEYITIKPVKGESSEQLKLNMSVGAKADIVKDIDFW
jgi:hypothetical protein